MNLDGDARVGEELKRGLLPDLGLWSLALAWTKISTIWWKDIILPFASSPDVV